MPATELDRDYDAGMAAITAPGGRIILGKDDQGRTIVTNFPATSSLECRFSDHSLHIKCSF